MSLNSHFELTYFRTLRVGIKKSSHKKRGFTRGIKPFQTTLSFRDCELKIPLLIYKNEKLRVGYNFEKEKISHIAALHTRARSQNFCEH